jgi:hypothetical protein
MEICLRTADIHAPHAEDDSYPVFCPPTHMQVLYKIYRKEPKGEVAKTGCRTVEVRNVHYILGVNAVAFARSLPEF